MLRWSMLLLVLLSSAPAAAATWKIDPFSFFHSPSDGYLAEVHGSPTFPVYFDKKEPGLWTIRIPRSALDRTGIPGPHGLTLSVKLAHSARGEVRIRDGEASVTLHAVLLVQSQRDEAPVRIPLMFTTEQAARSAWGRAESRTGEPLRPLSGHMQLNAVGVNPIGSESGAGTPFIVVLGGLVTGLPSELLQELKDSKRNQP